MGLLSEATFTNINSASVNLLATGTAFRDISWSYEPAGSEFGKQQDSGQQDGHVFIRKLTITINGLITGTSASDYWTHRQSVLNGFIVDQGAQTDYKHGRLTITPSGGSQVFADVVVDSDSFELAHDEAAALSSQYTVTLRCPYGYWRTTGSSAVSKI